MNNKGSFGRGPRGTWKLPGPPGWLSALLPWAYAWEWLSPHCHRVGGAPGRRGSPVAVEALQLALHGATDAAAVAAVQPVAHNTQAVVPLLPVKGKVLHLGCDTLATFGRGHRGSVRLLPGEDGGLSLVSSPPTSHDGGPEGPVV